MHPDCNNFRAPGPPLPACAAQVTVEDASVMEPVEGVKSIQKERWDLQCCICRQRMGAKIQCMSCYAAYHPLCGRIAGAWAAELES